MNQQNMTMHPYNVKQIAMRLKRKARLQAQLDKGKTVKQLAVKYGVTRQAIEAALR